MWAGWGEATERKKSTARSHLEGCKLSSVNTEAHYYVVILKHILLSESKIEICAKKNNLQKSLKQVDKNVGTYKHTPLLPLPHTHAQIKNWVSTP